MRSRLLFALGLLACGGKPADLGFVRRHVDGVETLPCLAWVDRHFTYRVDPALSARTPGDKGRAAVSAAVESWQRVAASCSDFTFSEDAGTATQNLIVFRDQSCTQAAPPNDRCFADGSCPDLFDCWDGDMTTLAVTTVTYSRGTGRLDRAEVQLDGVNFLFTNVDAPPCGESAQATTCVASDIQNTLTHELGHAVGFDHVNAAGSTMAPTAPVGEIAKRVIDPGTVRGFCTVYPADAGTPSCVGP